jgi:hypothetical protein
MGLYSLVNVPRANDKVEIVGHVDGENVYVLCAEKGSTWRDGRSTAMANTLVGDHMLSKPADLRRMYADDLATVIRLARDAGYSQAMADVRSLIGAK